MAVMAECFIYGYVCILCFAWLGLYGFWSMRCGVTRSGVLQKLVAKICLIIDHVALAKQEYNRFGSVCPSVSGRSHG